MLRATQSLALIIAAFCTASCQINTIDRVASDKLRSGRTYLAFDLNNRINQDGHGNNNRFTGAALTLERDSDYRCFFNDIAEIRYEDFYKGGILYFSVPPGRYVAKETFHYPSLPNEKVLSFEIKPNTVNFIGLLTLDGRQIALHSAKSPVKLESPFYYNPQIYFTNNLPMVLCSP